MKNKIGSITLVACIALLVSAISVHAEAGKGAPEIIEVKRIWDNAPHNAFTDLIRFRGQWFCAFREGLDHVSDDGKLRVIRSADGIQWSSAALLDWDGGDVRDAKLSVTADGRLMLNSAVRFLQPAGGNEHQSVSWFSADGRNWSEAFADDSGLGTWRWSVTWHKGTAYSFGYSGKDVQGSLYRSGDGKVWEVAGDSLYPGGEFEGNETSLLFLEDDTAYCLLRRDAGSGAMGMLGVSSPPYDEWNWKSTGVRIGGPKMIRINDGRFLAAVRLYESKGWYPAHTGVGWIDPESGLFTKILQFPSGGDTSYAGMVRHEGEVWVSYYSSHEEKTAIYLARININE